MSAVDVSAAVAPSGPSATTRAASSTAPPTRPRAEKPAFPPADATLTYRALRRRVNRAGQLLRSPGVA